MKKVFLMRMILFGSLLVLALPFGAHASSITFGSSSTEITFVGDGAGSVSVSTLGLSGNAFFDSDALGIYALGATSFTAGPKSAGIFPADANLESFTFTGEMATHLPE